MPAQIPRKIPPPKPKWYDLWPVKFSLDPQPAFLTSHSFQEFTATKSGDYSKQKLMEMCMDDIRSQEEDWTTGASLVASVIVDHDTSPNPTMGITLIAVRYNIEFTAHNPEKYWGFVEGVEVPLEWTESDNPYPMRFQAGFNGQFSRVFNQHAFVMVGRPNDWTDNEILTIQPNWVNPSYDAEAGLVRQVYIEPEITLNVWYPEIHSQDDFNYFFDDTEELDAILEEDEGGYAELSSPVIPINRIEEE